MGMKITLDLNFECINEEILKEYQAHLKKFGCNYSERSNTEK